MSDPALDIPVPAFAFGIVVMSERGQLKACGRGVPPRWVRDSAGAEHWAFRIAHFLALGVPSVVTDCLSVQAKAAAGVRAAACAPGRFAGICSEVEHLLVDRGHPGDALGSVAWMPAHKSATGVVDSCSAAAGS